MNNQIQLPASPYQVNGQAFNSNLPNGNDAWPPLNPPPNVPKEAVMFAVANLRTLAQSRATKSPIHCFAFNMLSMPATPGMPYFTGQLWQSKCQEAVDFTQFLMLRQGCAPQHAAELASTKIYLGMLAQLTTQYPVVAQMQGVTPDIISGLQRAMQEYQAICNDLQQTRMAYGGMQQPQQVATGNVGIHNYAVPGVAVAGAPQAPAQTTPTGTYMGDEFGLEQKPTTWKAGDKLVPTAQAPAQQPVKVEEPKQATPVYEESSYDAPQTVDDLVLDPYYYIPGGFEVNKERPYDRIRNPGGIEIRPAHQAKDWVRTRGDSQYYPMLVDPNQYIVFYAKWPDGRVNEVYMTTQNKAEMNYLMHEIDEQRRAAAHQSKGVVVPATSKIIDLDSEIKPIEKVKEELDDGLVLRGELDPVILGRVFAGSSDMENELDAREEVIRTLELTSEDPVPAHEYTSTRVQALDIDEETFLALDKLRTSDSISLTIVGLKELIDKGKLSPRIVNFLNDRLRTITNQYLKDSLGLDGIRITDFFEDAPQLGQYLATKRGSEFGKAFTEAVPTILNRGLNMARTENVETGEEDTVTHRYTILDEFVNFQLTWSSVDLMSMNIEREPVLVSNLTHPTVRAVLTNMLSRAREQEILKRVYLRLITSDGVYYEVISGKMVKSAILLKQL